MALILPPLCFLYYYSHSPAIKQPEYERWTDSNGIKYPDGGLVENACFLVDTGRHSSESALVVGLGQRPYKQRRGTQQ